jgi:hypothetical protein
MELPVCSAPGDQTGRHSNHVHDLPHRGRRRENVGWLRRSEQAPTPVHALPPFATNFGKPSKYLAIEYPLRLKTLRIDDGELMSAYDLEKAGAVLARPVGYVGWRSEPSFATLREDVVRSLGRTAYNRSPTR